jgi:hypothetical protein
MYNFSFISTPFIGNLISFEWIITNLLKFYLVTYSINPPIPLFPYESTICVTTLALGSRPRQGLVKLQTKCEDWESHFMHLGVWESVK